MLVNNSKRPLILLAGEIVTGGKQDRIIGKDRLVPAESDPIDLSVFCVEPGRWVGASGNFQKTPGMVSPQCASKAMADKDQQKVWSEVGAAQTAMAAAVPPSIKRGWLKCTGSYAGVIQNDEVERKLDAVAAPVEHEYQSVIRQLKDKNAVGVVVAVNGRDHLGRHFCQQRSAGEVLAQAGALLCCGGRHRAGASMWSSTEKAAQQFLNELEGRRQVVESEPGLFRHRKPPATAFGCLS